MTRVRAPAAMAAAGAAPSVPRGLRASGALGHLKWLVMALAIVVFAGGCASPPPLPRPPASWALPASASSLFEPTEREVAAAHGAESSAFHLLDRSEDGLRWRLVLIDGATQSLDLQYYVWFGDASGQLLLSRVLAAADRGVRVRLLLDDLSTMLRRMSSPELRDRLLQRVDRHPNIDVRVFNPWRERGWLGRLLEGARDFDRLNRRMHNKQLIADNRAVVIGGRNIGDEYFGLNPDFNFHDLDVLGIGPVARQASAAFDRYWNSEWVQRMPQTTSSDDPQDDGTGAAALDPPDWPTAVDAAVAGLLGTMRHPQAELASLRPGLAVGTARVRSDPPSRAEGSRNRMARVVRELMASATHEVLISNAYVIPDDTLVADLAALQARGVRVRLLTNSLASHDVPAVNAHYERWRRPLLAAGVELHELRADAAVQRDGVEIAPVRGAFVGLHTKALVVDRRRSFIGSMNLDPRSEVFNAEMGVVIDSPALGEALARQITRDLQPDTAWQVLADPDGTLRWVSTAGDRRTQPARHPWQRVQNLLFKLAPASYY